MCLFSPLPAEVVVAGQPVRASLAGSGATFSAANPESRFPRNTHGSFTLLTHPSTPESRAAPSPTPRALLQPL